MPEAYFDLSPKDRYDALEVAASRSGKPGHLLEKDVWVVWTLSALFDAPFAQDIVFKGGTSLSKGYQAIERFSEDVDVTYDIRAIAPDLTSADGENLPLTRSQEQRWTRIIRQRLEVWVRDTVSPILIERLKGARMAALVTAEADTVQIEYEEQAEGYSYVRPVVLLEFGDRSTGEPFERRPVTCDAASHLPEVTFPEAAPAVMRPERTFWEKATAIHVFCRGGRFRGPERFSRHWYDLASLDQTEFVASAISDRDLAQQVARHKSVFFREKDGEDRIIDYEDAVRGGLQRFPTVNRKNCSPRTMPAWLLMDSCSKTRLTSRRSSIGAVRSKTAPTAFGSRLAHRWKRASRSGSPTNVSGNTLSATSRLSLVSRAR